MHTTNCSHSLNPLYLYTNNNKTIFNQGCHWDCSKKVGNYRWTGGLGVAPWWGFKLELFSQSELPRKPPIDTHGRYTCIQCMHGGKKERKEGKKRGEKKVGKSEGLKKSEFRQKSEKRHPCQYTSNLQL